MKHLIALILVVGFAVGSFAFANAGSGGGGVKGERGGSILK